MTVTIDTVSANGSNSHHKTGFMIMFNAEVLFVLGAARFAVVQGGYPYWPPTSCDGVVCPAGYECVVKDAPGNCPSCQPQAVCKPTEHDNASCGTGEAYDYQKGKCVPYTCESPDACPDGSTCKPANPGIQYCNHKYQTTGVPCEFFTCDDYNPCAAKSCLVGNRCEVVNGVAECVCDTPTYVFNDFQQKCVPNSCDAVNACPQDVGCYPGIDPNCQGNCRPFTCGVCPPGKVYDEYYKKCVIDPCASANCPTGSVCRLTHSGSNAYECVCEDGYEYDPSKGKCVMVDHDPCSTVHCGGNQVCSEGYCCPIGKPIWDSSKGMCVGDDPVDPCAYTTCLVGNECSEGICTPVSCDAPNACPVGKVCVDDPKTCIRAPCVQFVCDDDTPDPCDSIRCPNYSVCETYTLQNGQLKGKCACSENYEWHPYFGIHGGCVPKNCNAANACPYGKTCVPYDRTCPYSGPCPQYYCKHH